MAAQNSLNLHWEHCREEEGATRPSPTASFFEAYHATPQLCELGSSQNDTRKSHFSKPYQESSNRRPRLSCSGESVYSTIELRAIFNSQVLNYQPGNCAWEEGGSRLRAGGKHR